MNEYVVSARYGGTDAEQHARCADVLCLCMGQRVRRGNQREAMKELETNAGDKCKNRHKTAGKIKKLDTYD